MKEPNQETKQEMIPLSEAIGNLQIQKLVWMEQQTIMLERIAKALEKNELGKKESSTDDDEDDEDFEGED